MKPLNALVVNSLPHLKSGGMQVMKTFKCDHGCCDCLVVGWSEEERAARGQQQPAVLLLRRRQDFVRGVPERAESFR